MKKKTHHTLDIFVPRTSFILCFCCSSSSCSVIVENSLEFVVSVLYKIELFPNPPSPVVVVVANNC